MSEEPSPPDLINTDDIPLDEVLATNIIQPETIAEALGSTGALFADARPLGLSSPDSADGVILENAVRTSAPRMPSMEAASSGVGRFLPSPRAKGNPIYRRQGILAVIALGVLTLIALVTFPRSESTLESGSAVSTDAPPPAAGAVGSNAGDGVNEVGSDGFFVRSKSERVATDADLAKIADPQSKDAADFGVGATTTDGNVNIDGDGQQASDETNPDDTDADTAGSTSPPDTEVDTSVLVGPDTTHATTVPETETTSEVVPTTQTPSTQTPAATRPQTTTTERRTTTTRRATTTAEPSSTTTATTAPPSTRTTIDPDDTTTTTATTTATAPSSTTTTIDPDDTTTTSVTIPDDGPNEDPNTSQGPVFCADNPEACPD